MTLTLSRCILLAAGMLIAGTTAAAHHSFAMFDLARHITIKGAVAEYHWINPHAHIIVNVPAGAGIEAGWVGEWDVECASTQIMGLQGWSRTTFKPGDQVTLVGSPLRDGNKGLSLFYAVMPDGSRLYRDIARPKPGQ